MPQVNTQCHDSMKRIWSNEYDSPILSDRDSSKDLLKKYGETYKKLNATILRCFSDDSSLSSRSSTSSSEKTVEMVHESISIEKEIGHVDRKVMDLIEDHYALLKKISNYESKNRKWYRRWIIPGLVQTERKLQNLRHELCGKSKAVASLEMKREKLYRKSIDILSSSSSNRTTLASNGSSVNGSTADLSQSLEETTDLSIEFSSPTEAFPQRLDKLILRKSEVADQILSCYYARLGSHCSSDRIYKLHEQLGIQKSELHSLYCIQNQVEQLTHLYHEILHLLQSALALIFSPDYTHTMREFVMGPYPLAIEAGRLIYLSTMYIQPETKRKYTKFTESLTRIHLPKFPETIKEFIQPSALIHRKLDWDIKCSEKYFHVEDVVIRIQQVTCKNMQMLEKWTKYLNVDQKKLENRVQDLQMKKDVALEALVNNFDSLSPYEFAYP